jgi:hypothetical protein
MVATTMLDTTSRLGMAVRWGSRTREMNRVGRCSTCDGAPGTRGLLLVPGRLIDARDDLLTDFIVWTLGQGQDNFG